MNDIKRLLESLSWKQMISLALAAGAVITALTMFSHWNRERDFRPLFSALSPEDAAAVLAKVRESGTPYRLSDDGSSVLVPSARVAEMRLQLAAAGVPKSGRIGYELFDKSNFGLSDFSEQVNYHRALEGELERSVMSLQAVEQARVHITFPKDSLFLDNQQPAKASVLVRLRPGAQLTAQNVASICQLTASAVEGLQPEAVSVVDSRGNLLNRARKPGSPDSPEPSEADLDYQQKLEHALLAKINSTLDPLLGADKYRATASVDCDFTSAEQNEETFDPAKSVMTSSQKTEDINGGTVASGIPGTASSLPRPTSRPATGHNAVTRRTENITYESSHTVRHIREPEGTIKRISVALLVDSDVRYEGAGTKARRIVEPPSAAKLKTISDLVAGVIGLSPDRGDRLVVETLPFESTLNPEQLPAAGPQQTVPQGSWQQLLGNKMFTIGIGAVAAILLALVFLVFRRKSRNGRAELPAELPAGPTSDQLQGQIENRLAEQAAMREKQELEVLNSLKLPPATKKTEVLTKHIAEQVKKDSGSMVQVLRAWMDPGEEMKR